MLVFLFKKAINVRKLIPWILDALFLYELEQEKTYTFYENRILGKSMI